MSDARPQDIQARTADRALAVVWSDGRTCEYPFVRLRRECRCAGCVDEITGERLLDPDAVDPEITIRSMQLVGNYALKIDWSDGHDTGLYTWRLLRELADRL